MPRLVSQCPSCGGPLQVLRLGCPGCDIGLEGQFELGVLSRLAPAEQEFLLEFVKSSGSLKEMARRFQVSYPTVRNRLDELIARVKALQTQEEQDER